MGISPEGLPLGIEKEQGKKSSMHFSNPTTNATIYLSFLMNMSEESTEEEEEEVVGDDDQDTDFISMSCFELIE